MSTTMKIEVLRNKDGSVNVTETLESVEQKLLSLNKQESMQNDMIYRHVHTVFDTHLGKKLTIPSLQSSVLHLMMQENPNEASLIMDNFKEWQDAVRSFIRNSNEFGIAKGKGGGVYRLRDVR